MADTVAVEESALTSLKSAYTTLATDVKSASGYISANCELTDASGLLLAPLQPAYNACRDIASQAVTALGTALSGLAKQVDGALSDAQKTESANQSVTSKLNQVLAELAQVNAKLSGSGSGGGGGYSGGGDAGGGGGSTGSASGADGGSAGGSPTSSLGGSAAGEVPTPSDTPASAGTQPAGTPAATTTPTGTPTPGAQSTGAPSAGAPAGGYTVDVQDNGQDDIVTVGPDGSVSVSVDPTSPALSGAPTTGGDVTVTVGSGAAPDFSVADNGAGGVTVGGVTLGSDTTASTTDASAYSQPTDSQLGSMSATDPLGRSTADLQSAWQARETFTFDDPTATGLITDTAAGGTTLDVTALMGLVKQAETQTAQNGALTWAQ